MIFFVLSRNGFNEIEPLIKPESSILWLSAGVLNKEEITKLRSEGVDVTNFAYCIKSEDQNELSEAINTISEHHPEQNIWVETRTKT